LSDLLSTAGGGSAGLSAGRGVVFDLQFFGYLLSENFNLAIIILVPFSWLVSIKVAKIIIPQKLVITLPLHNTQFFFIIFVITHGI